MAIDRPGAIEPHPRRSRRAAAQRRTVGRRLSCLAQGMPSAGAPARGVARQGKKVDRPPLRADDRGAAGPRPDSPIRGPRGAPGSSARRRGGNRLHDARGRMHRARKDLRRRVNSGDASSRRYCRPDDRRCVERVRSRHELHSWPFAVQRRLCGDEARDIAWAETWGEADRDLRRAGGREPELCRSRRRPHEIKNHQLSWWFEGEPLKAVLKDSATFGMGLWDH